MVHSSMLWNYTIWRYTVFILSFSIVSDEYRSVQIQRRNFIIQQVKTVYSAYAQDDSYLDITCFVQMLQILRFEVRFHSTFIIYVLENAFFLHM